MTFQTKPGSLRIVATKGLPPLENANMMGPKLDARAYAILILAVIGLVATTSLVAQTDPSRLSSSTGDVAAANREIARALSEIARSNAQIAASIDKLSTSVGQIKAAIEKGAAKSGEAAAAPSEVLLTPGSANPDRDSGVFQLR